MTNSAHDAIHLTKPLSELDNATKEQLSLLGSKNGSNAVHLLELIQDLSAAKEHDHATVSTKTISLKLNYTSEVYASFDVSIMTNPGWLTLFNKEIRTRQLIKESTLGELKDWIEKKQFCITYCDYIPDHLKVHDFYNYLDIYRIGRPSTLPNIIAAMEQAGLIYHADNSVKLTAIGYSIHSAMKYAMPNVADKAFSTKMAKWQLDIERGKSTVYGILSTCLPMISNRLNEKLLAIDPDDLWDDIDDIYADEDNQTSHTAGGLIAYKKDNQQCLV